MSFEKIDRAIIYFFIGLLRTLKKIRITQAILVNILLFTQIGAQIAQVIFLYYRGEDTITILIITIPTWLFIWYFKKILHQPEGRTTWIDTARVFSALHAGSAIILFCYYLILSKLHLNMFSTIELLSELMRLVISVTFMSILYLLTCGEPKQQIELPGKSV